jgi:o-succinylbenzoate synthase
MRIERLEAIPYALPFKQPYVTARGTLERREIVLIRMHTDEGAVGLGDAVPLSLRRGATLGAIEGALPRTERRLRRAEISDFAGPQPLAAAIDTFIHAAAGRRLPPPAAAAIEMALFDLAGKISGMPLWRLFGVERPEPVRCNATLTAGAPEAVAAEAQRWAELGFETFKLKLGTGDDLEQVAAVREALGPQARIRVDANGTWPADDAVAILDRLAPLDVELAEQPVATLREMAQVAAASSIPIAADESVTTAKEARKAVGSGACELATVKLAKVGGMGRGAGIAAELPVYLSSALDGPLGIAAAGHAAQALYRDRVDPGVAHGLATQLMFSGTIATRECELRGGELHLPEGPGLGVEIDTAALERHRFQ